jgi:hypothetical protein
MRRSGRPYVSSSCSRSGGWGLWSSSSASVPTALPPMHQQRQAVMQRATRTAAAALASAEAQGLSRQLQQVAAAAAG